MANHSLISVIVPVFNCGPYLEQCLQSLYSQTLSDFEVIICDDASTDDSANIAERWQHKDSRFKVFKHAKNVGMTRNWNQGLSYASGDFIMKLDADDCFTPETLERLYDSVSPDEVDIAFCRTAECDEELSVLRGYRGEKALLDAGIDPTQNQTMAANAWYQLAFSDKQIWHSNAFMVPRAIMRQLSGWDERFGCASDTDLIIRLLELNIKITHVAYVGVLYRMREGSVSHGFRVNDTLVDEGYAVNLNSLRRTFDSGKTLSYRVILNWYRLHQNTQQRQKKSAPSSQLLDAEAMRLPLHIRLIGTLQRRVHRAKTSLFG